MSLSKRSVINITSGGLGYAIPILVNIVSIPIIIHKLGNESYGLLNLVNIIIGYLVVSDMGLDIPITQYVAECSALKNFYKLRKLLSTSLQIYLRIGVCGMIVVVLLSGILSKHIFKIPAKNLDEAHAIFILAGIGFFLSILNMFAKAVFNGLQKYEISNGINVIQNFLAVSIGILFILHGSNIVTYVFIRILFYLIAFLSYLYLLKKEIQFRLISSINRNIWNLLKKQFGYGLALRIGSLFFSRIDQTLIGIWIGVSFVGVYAIPVLITSSISALIGNITQFTFPKTTELYSTGRIEEFKLFFFRNTKFVAIIAASFFVPVIIFSGHVLKLWVGADISSKAHIPLIILGISYFINSVTTITLISSTVGIGKLNKFTVYVIIRGAVMTIGCILLIKKYELIGASVAMLITCIVDVLFFVIAIKRYFHLSVFSLAYQAIFKVIICASALGVPFYYLSMIQNFGVGKLLLFVSSYDIILMLLLITVNIIDKEERAYVINIVYRAYRKYQNI